MDYKRCPRILFASLLCCITIAPLWGQSTNPNMEIRIIQRLAWSADEYASRYEVVIEQEEEGVYRHALREYTENAFIEVSLPPGSYRYRVIPHDFLGLPIPVSEWLNFEVLRRAAEEQPESAPESAAEIKNQFDIFLGAAWIPLLPFYSENQFFSENLSVVGAGLRFAIVSASRRFLHPGMEVTAAWRAFGAQSGSEELEAPVKMQSLSFDFNFLAQYRFSNGRCALNFRLGAGVSLRSSLQPVPADLEPPDGEELKPDMNRVYAVGDYSIHANCGISFVLLLFRNLYTEIGIDYSQFFTKDYFGFIRPWVAVGVRW